MRNFKNRKYPCLSIHLQSVTVYAPEKVQEFDPFEQNPIQIGFLMQ